MKSTRMLLAPILALLALAASTLLASALWHGPPPVIAASLPGEKVYLPAVYHSVLPPTPTPVPPTPTPIPPPPPVDIEQTRFGLVWVNSAEDQREPARIQRGAAAQATWDRLVLYWSNIEPQPGVWDWSKQDHALRENEAAGLRTLAILLNLPGHAYPSTVGAQGTRELPPVGGGPLRFEGDDVAAQGSCSGGPLAPRGLDAPIFADGSDWPAPGKAINPNNLWARFVYEAVERYRPGGSAGLHVRDWEIWNEEDLCHFWSGTAQQYARLLKVAYIVIKRSDPAATVVWGGLAHFQQPQFLHDMLETIKADPMAPAFNGYFDAAGSHQYSTATDGLYFTRRIRDALATTPWADAPIWVTESGVPVCDDYPGPACPSPYRANPIDQASYIWQNIAYSRVAGAGPIFHFQLHDDCGNVVAPNSPDGFGLVKNEASSYCSPSQAEPRLSYTAYQQAVRFLTGTAVWWSDIQDPSVHRVAFYHHGSGERRTIVWAVDGHDAVARVPAMASSARLVEIDGRETIVTPTNGEYLIPLQRATNQSRPGESLYTIGGPPRLLIERDSTGSSTDIIPNGGFEQDAAWTFGANEGATGSYISHLARSGARAARLGIEPPTADLSRFSSVYQRVQIPPDTTSAQLSLWAWLRTEEDPAGGSDVHQFLLLDKDLKVLKVLWSGKQNGAGWQHFSFDLTAHRGQTIHVYVNAKNDGNGRRTWLYLDDVSLTVTR